jgi:hypothetical protein
MVAEITHFIVLQTGLRFILGFQQGLEFDSLSKENNRYPGLGSMCIVSARQVAEILGEATSVGCEQQRKVPFE